MCLIPKDGLYHAGRQFSKGEVKQIIETARDFPCLPRTELADTICEHLSWYSPTGSYKTTACLNLLEQLEKEGWFRLKPKRRQASPKKRSYSSDVEIVEPAPICCTLGALGGVEVHLVESKERLSEWKAYVDRYHELGYKKPFGCFLRYFVVSSRGLLGCIQFAGAAKALEVRDRWIGWTQHQRLNNVGWIINNNRFLIFPWVKVKNLASHVLGRIRRCIVNDWQDRWGYEPVVMETFVDPSHYRGSCYRGAGWRELGLTSGRGLVREGCRYTTSPKMVFVHPLTPHFRSLLCSDTLSGRVPE